jgi:NADH pyrophosphatase NudC (nudix superfamily)
MAKTQDQIIRELRKTIKNQKVIIDYFYDAAPDWTTEEAIEIDASLRGMRFCSECGNETPRRRKICVTCGTKENPNDERTSF